MLAFANDYSKGAHPAILQRFIDTNLDPQPGYGQDAYSASATEKIRRACDCPEAQVTYISGGTQANAVIISTVLKDYQGVVAADTGHVSIHEAGSIEYTGHKVLTIPGHDGKIDAHELAAYINGFYEDDNHIQMVYPGMVYISQPTEYGTLYSKTELTDISAVCRKYDIPLFMDGARLGYGLMSPANDITLPELAKLVDVFYIGGTKVGALCGEAVVFTHDNQPEFFNNRVKRRGAQLAKGRLIGVQFETLFTDDLYFKISAHAIEMAKRLKAALTEKGYQFFIDSPTNQQFVVVDNAKMATLKNDVDFSFWEKIDDTHTAIRLVTSWSTTEDEVEQLKQVL